jgi:uncharacterized membrane protein HdeD (DUF308 family)
MNGTSVVESIKENWGWLLALGIAYIIMGLVITGSPIAATLAVEILIGFVLIIGGIISIIGAFFSGNWKRLLLILLSGILYLVVGVLLLKNPLQGVLTLTILLAAFLLVEGIFKVIHAFQMKPAPNWIWLLVSGVASVILGVMIWGGFPQSSSFVIGLLVGIYFLINGITMVMFSFAVKNHQVS